jgi:hypothetical protein
LNETFDGDVKFLKIAVLFSEEYLDSLVSDEDHKYLEDEEMARQIAELGYRFYLSTKFRNLPYWMSIFRCSN